MLSFLFDSFISSDFRAVFLFDSELSVRQEAQEAAKAIADKSDVAADVEADVTTAAGVSDGEAAGQGGRRLASKDKEIARLESLVSQLKEAVAASEARSGETD